MAKSKETLERAQRLRTLRDKTGLSRSAFAEKLDISEHTLKSLEIGTRNLSAPGARELSRMLLLLGLDVSFESLYYGADIKHLEQKEVVINDERHIYNETIWFKNNNPSSIIFTVPDSLMSPYFNKGDVVGGQKIINEHQFPFLDGQICIIEAANGAQYLRRVIKSAQRKVICCTLNPDNNNAPPIQEIEAISIAQVTRHWLLSSLVPNLHVGQLVEKVAYPPPGGAKRKKPSRKKVLPAP